MRLTKNIALLMMQFCYYGAENLAEAVEGFGRLLYMTTESQQDSYSPLSEQITRDYRILRLLGKGGMGEVYLAEQLRVGRRLVALKVLNRSSAARPEMAQRFENEASSGGRINHRNVVTVYESRITDDGQMYVAMEFVEGRSLTEYLKEKGPLALDQVIEITRQMCAGLAAAHKLGIIHRDIKPDNIMLTEEEGGQVVKLLDFGIARLSETDPSIGKTRAGVIMGTPTYMSPEQAMGKTGDRIDARSDIYSLGIVIYQMLTGHVAFKAPTPLEIMRMHISEPPAPLKHWQPDLNLPDAVEQVVLKALQKDRKLRQQTITELATELEAAATGISPMTYLSQKDLPTVRITKEAATFATAPLSSEKTSPGHSRALPPKTRQKTSTANHSQTNFKPVQQAATPPVRPETINESARHIQSQKSRSYKKELLLASLVLLAILVAVVGVIKMTGKSDGTVVSPLSNRLLEYRIKREYATGELETLPLDNTIGAGEGFGFEVKLIERGSVYMFSELTENNESLWQWLNPPPSANTQPPGEWFTFPFKWLIADDKTSAKKYLLVYVPNGLNWSVAQTLASEQLSIKNGVADIPPEIASRIQQSLKQDAADLNAVSSQQGKVVSFSLSKRDGSRQIGFYEIRMDQMP
jgi:serine/threonine-protein kinase